MYCSPDKTAANKPMSLPHNTIVVALVKIPASNSEQEAFHEFDS